MTRSITTIAKTAGIDLSCTCKGCSFYLRLEAERMSIAYRTQNIEYRERIVEKIVEVPVERIVETVIEVPVDRVVTEVVEKLVEVPTGLNPAEVEELKKIYFNAGRFAGGSRDDAASRAFERLNEIEGNA